VSGLYLLAGIAGGAIATWLGVWMDDVIARRAYRGPRRRRNSRETSAQRSPLKFAAMFLLMLFAMGSCTLTTLGALGVGGP
jgi:hypothetical protein